MLTSSVILLCFSLIRSRSPIHASVFPALSGCVWDHRWCPEGTVYFSEKDRFFFSCFKHLILLKPYCPLSPCAGRAEGSGEPQGTHPGSHHWAWACSFVTWSFCICQAITLFIVCSAHVNQSHWFRWLDQACRPEINPTRLGHGVSSRYYSVTAELGLIILADVFCVQGSLMCNSIFMTLIY